MCARQKKTKLVDEILRRQLCEDKNLANAMILAGQVRVDGELVTRPAFLVSSDNSIEIVGVKQFVSRGGIKLAHALESFSISIENKNCLDIGSSTGGFSDCLLQANARRVACVDVNYGQLAWSIRTNERVDVFERTNIKHANNEMLGGPFNVVVIDVSFIGLATLANKIAELTDKGGNLIALVKPQFEAKSTEVSAGRVEDDDVRERTVAEVAAALREHDFDVKDVCESPILGNKKHNKEYFISAIKI